MLTIRLTRKGKKNQPFFRVALIDKKRSSKGGRTVEDLGYVDPLKKRKNFKKERIQYWLSKGAQASATVHNFLVSEKIIDAQKIHVSRVKKSAETAEAKPAEPEAKPAAEAPIETVSGTSNVLSNEPASPTDNKAEELPPAEAPTEIGAPKEEKPEELPPAE